MGPTHGRRVSDKGTRRGPSGTRIPVFKNRADCGRCSSREARLASDTDLYQWWAGLSGICLLFGRVQNSYGAPTHCCTEGKEASSEEGRGRHDVQVTVRVALVSERPINTK
jgi:hypothetical protein